MSADRAFETKTSIPPVASKLTPDEYKALSLLEGRSQGMSYQSVAECLDIEPFEAGKMMNRLCDDGLCVEPPNQSGMTRFHITPSGLDELKRPPVNRDGYTVPKQPRFK